ncbi:hypothetical protein [Desulfonatronum parangueonense]
MEKDTLPTLRTLVRSGRDQGLSEKMIERIAGLEVAINPKSLRNEPINLPPHLLTPADAPDLGRTAR